MKKSLYFLRRLLALSLLVQLLLPRQLVAQTITVLPNPDASTRGFSTDITTPHPVILNNMAYGSYLDINGKNRLYQFDGNKTTLIANPDNGRGLGNDYIVFNNAIYLGYVGLNSANETVLSFAKFDGKSIKKLTLPAGFQIGGDIKFIILNNVLYGRCIGATATNGFQTYYLFKLTDSTTPDSFAITGVTAVSCSASTATKRTLTFTPQYAGLTGQAVTFFVANETQPTTKSGPYTLTLYIDNPTITLKASQTGTAGEASFAFNWLAYCSNGARTIPSDSGGQFVVTAIPNPSSGQSVDVEVNGSDGQPVEFQVIDEQGKSISKLRIEQASEGERIPVRLGSSTGIYLLKVSTPTQSKTLKVLKN